MVAFLLQYQCIQNDFNIKNQLSDTQDSSPTRSYFSVLLIKMHTEIQLQL